MIATEITKPANPMAQISTLYFEFWASILDSKRTVFASILEFRRSLLLSIRSNTFEDAILLRRSVSSTASSGLCPAFRSRWEIRVNWPTWSESWSFMIQFTAIRYQMFHLMVDTLSTTLYSSGRKQWSSGSWSYSFVSFPWNVRFIQTSQNGIIDNPLFQYLDAYTDYIPEHVQLSAALN